MPSKKKRLNIWISSIIIVGLIIIVSSLIIYFVPEEEAPYYSDDPLTWVEDKKEIKEINIDKVTEGQGYVDFNGQQLITAEIGTVFSYEGWYDGIYFREWYTDLNGNTLMKITLEMNPNDGIIEGFVVERIIDSKPIIYVFLDNDWKTKLPDTRIYWGKRYQNEKDFEFLEVSSGVYMDKVEDDINRFENNFNLHHGGVYVGDLRDDNRSTIISFS